MKIRKILGSLAVASALASSAFGFVGMDGAPTIDENRDTILPVSSGEKVLFYILINKSQNDPSLFLINNDKLEEDGYKCKTADGKRTFSCKASQFYETTIWSSNSVGAKIYLEKKDLEILKANDTKIVFLNRLDQRRDGDRLRNGKPFMKVYIDKDGYLNAEFARLTGGVSQAKTDKPIPTDEPVYIQANENGEKYEVGWKGLNSNKTSFGKNSHQTSPIDSDVNATIKPMATLNFNYMHGNNELSALDSNIANEIEMSGYFWNTKINMFANIDKDITKMLVYQIDNTLKLDIDLVGRIVSDLKGQTQNFPGNTMHVYSVPDVGIITDIRTRR